MKLPLLFLFLFNITTRTLSQSQDKYVYYFDKDLNSTNKKDAIYTGIGSQEDSLIRVKIFGNYNGHKIKVDAHFTDSTLQTFYGDFQSFYTNGQTELQGKYINGVESGLWVKFDTAGRALDSSIYSEKGKLNSVLNNYESSGKIFSKETFDYVKTTYTITSFDSLGKVSYQGDFIGDNGIVKYYKASGIEIDTVHSRERHFAHFPGGEEAGLAYVRNAMIKNLEKLANAGESGTCQLKLKIAADGKVTSIVSLTMANSVLSNILIKALQEGPDWLPAVKFGVPVESTIIQPVTFTVTSDRN